MITIPLEVDVCLELEAIAQDYADGCPDIGGRFCSDKCCLPCPLTELVYSDGEYITQEAVLYQADIVVLKLFLHAN